MDSLQRLSQDEIISHWKYTDKVYVSCVCATFNQYSYIKETLDGFLAQKTDYRFEIVVHDDASTDGTSDILKDYQKKYPELIKLIIQKENQYSKGNRQVLAIALKMASGDYLAFCEGDDYWIDEFKLQKQILILDKYKDINLCVHDAYIYHDKDKVVTRQKFFTPKKDGIVSIKEVFKFSGQFSPTASMFIRKIAVSNLPDFFYKAPIDDFFYEVITGKDGIYFMRDKMSVYRVFSEGSWSNDTLLNIKNKIDYNISMLKSLDQLKIILNKRESKYIKYKKQFLYYDLVNCYFKQGNNKLAIYNWLCSLYGMVNLKSQIILILKLFNLK